MFGYCQCGSFSVILDYLVVGFFRQLRRWLRCYGWCHQFHTVKHTIIRTLSTIKCAENMENKLCHSLFLDEPVNYYMFFCRCAAHFTRHIRIAE